MRRPAPALAAMTMLLLLAACATTAAPPATPGAPTPTAEAPADSPAADPTAPAADDEPTPEPVPAWTGHPADGLAIVRLNGPDDPVTNVWVVEADGAFRQVTGLSNRLGASHPGWSADGSQIVFGGAKLETTTILGQIAVVNADGTGERQIGQGAFAQWSPDGTRIAYNEVDDVTGEDLSFYVVDVASGQTTDLGLGFMPRWLGDDRLLFGSNSYAANGVVTSSLYVMDLATGEREHIADWASAYPSPDGTTYVLELEGGELTHVSGDGTELAALGTGWSPVWSPDGSMVAIGYEIDNDANSIYAVVDLEGNSIASGIVGNTPTWSPDGTRLAVEVYRETGPIVQVVEIATGTIVWETEGQQPAWRP